MGNIILERDQNPHLCHSGPVCYHYTIQATCCHHYIHTHLCVWLLASEVSADYYTCTPGIVSLLLLTITYMLAMALHLHTQGRFNNHTVYSLYRTLVTTTSVVGVIKMGSTVPRVALKPTSLAFRASVLPFHHVGSLCPPVYADRSLSQRSVQTTTLIPLELYVF